MSELKSRGKWKEFFMEWGVNGQCAIVGAHNFKEAVAEVKRTDPDSSWSDIDGTRPVNDQDRQKAAAYAARIEQGEA